MQSIVDKIQKLKKEKNAVILAHNYQVPEVQDIADFTGDSLGLSWEAANCPAEVIVFCGVYFMAETAKILSPQKTVLIPDPSAGCPMADMLNADQLRLLKKEHPNAKVVCYVNSTAEVKAESDVCCTSANAVDLLANMFSQKDEIIFVPDKYLGSYAASQTGRNVIIWNGYCPTHARILPEHIEDLRKKHPQAKVIVHPECSAAVIRMADKVVSTGGMLRYVKENDAKEFIVATEEGMMHPLKKAAPEKQYYGIKDFALCPNMKKITLPKVLNALENMQYQVTLDEEIRQKAYRSIKAMLDFSFK